MKNMIPHFIAEKYQDNSIKGSLMATALFLDISGFTPMTSTLMDKGKEGAEILSGILNRLFFSVIQVIYNRGGFITVFGGDAFTAVFPDEQNHSEDLLNPLRAASEIKDYFTEHGLQKTKFRDFTISLKLGLSYGQVHWTILKGEVLHSYYFGGEAIDGCAASERLCKKMEIVLDENLFLRVQDRIDTMLQGEEGYYVLEKLLFDGPPIKTTTITYEDTERIHDKILKKFIPKELVDYQPIGEFRNVVSIFLSVKIPEKGDSLNSLFRFVMNQANIFGGSINKIDTIDGFGTLLVFFGAPVSFENDIERAINFVLTIREQLGAGFRAGITSGIAYYGPIGSERRAEYTCLGDVINLAARFMAGAPFKQVWVSNEIKERAQNSFIFQDIGEHRFKGKEDSIAVFRLEEKKLTRDHLMTGKMVGRKTELQLLQSFCQESILQGRFGGVVYVYGEAGMGKSRLVTEALSNLPVKTCILQTDSILKKSLNPFAYFLKDFFQQYKGAHVSDRKNLFEEQLEVLLTTLEKMPDPPIAEIQELQRTRSIIGAVLGLFWEGSLYDELSAKDRYDNTFFALKNFFKGLSRIQPIVILLEDLHWIDPDSTSLLESLTRNIYDYPLIVFTTSRINDDGTKPKLTLEEVSERELLVEPLSDDLIQQFIENQLGHKVDTNLTQEMKHKSQGNPFYIEQLCLYVREKDSMELSGDSLIRNRPSETLPIGIHAILMARIDRLSQEIKKMIQVASVLGHEVDLNILYPLIQSIDDILREDFHQLVQKIQGEQIWSALHELRYIFQHALFRDTIYEMQLRKTLQLLHRLTAKTMEQFYSQEEERSAEIAFHYDKAEEREKAIYFYEKASESAQNNYSNSEALLYINRLLELVRDEKKIIEIQNQQATVLHLIGKWDQANAVLQKNIVLAEKLGDQQLLGQIKNRIGRLLSLKGDNEEALEFLNSAKDLLNNREDPILYGQIESNIGAIYLSQGDYQSALNCFQEYKCISLELSHKDGYATAICNLGLLYSEQGNYDKALEYHKEFLNLSLELKDKRKYSYAVGNMAVAYYERGDYDKAMECLEERRIISKEIGDIAGYSKCIANIGVLYWDRGTYEKAMECFSEQKKIDLELGNKKGYASAIGNMGTVYHDKGDFDQAIECYQECRDMSLKIRDKSTYSFVLGNLGEIYMFKGEYEEALEYLNETIEIGRELGTKFFLCQFLYYKAKTLSEIGKTTEAIAMNDEALSIAEEISNNHIRFQTTLLKETLNKDSSSLIHRLNNDALSQEERAAIYYAVGEVTGSSYYKKESIQRYKKLYQKIPKYEYKRRIDSFS